MRRLEIDQEKYNEEMDVSNRSATIRIYDTGLEI